MPGRIARDLFTLSPFLTSLENLLPNCDLKAEVFASIMLRLECGRLPKEYQGKTSTDPALIQYNHICAATANRANAYEIP